MKNANTGQRAFVIFVALIFLGSMGGALLYSTGTNNSAIELPASRITGEVSDAQKQRILFGSEADPYDRYVLITLVSPKTCDLDCNRAKMILQQMVTAFDPAVYVSEVQTESQSLEISILMESFSDKKELPLFNQTAVEDFICDNSIYRIDECVIRKMNLGVLNENENKKETITGNSTTSNSTVSANVPAANSTTE